MEIGENSTSAPAGALDPFADSDPAESEQRLRLWIVDPRYVLVQAKQSLPYKVLDEGGSVLAAGTLEGHGYIDVAPPPTGRISVWLDGEMLTTHDPV